MSAVARSPRAAATAPRKETTVKKLLLLAGLGAGAFMAWKKLAGGRREDDMADDMYGSATIHQQADQQPAPTP